MIIPQYTVYNDIQLYYIYMYINTSYIETITYSTTSIDSECPIVDGVYPKLLHGTEPMIKCGDLLSFASFICISIGEDMLVL